MKSTFLLIITVLAMQSAYSQNIASSADDICPLKIGLKIPDATLRKVDGSQVQIQDILKEKPTVLIFYRGGWCPFCNLHMAALQEYVPKFIDLGFQIIAISPDKPENLQKSIDKNDLTYTLLSDSKLEFTQMMGLAFRVSDATNKRYLERSNPINLAEASGENHQSLPVPAAYVVDTEGIVHYSYVNPNYRVRIDPEVLLITAKTMINKEKGP